MARRKGLTPDEIVKLLQELSDSDSGSETNPNPQVDKENDSSSGSEFIVNGSNAVSSSSSSENDNKIDSANSSSKAVCKRNSKKRGRNNTPQSAKFEEIAKDGTKWKVQNSANTSGRRGLQNILRENAGPTFYAKSRVYPKQTLSAWRLMINDKILRIIKDCTSIEAQQQLQNDSWNISLNELEAFISLLYVRGALTARGLPILSLWSKTWGPNFFPETMSRDRFIAIMKYLRFDKKSTRKLRLPNDKFALISEVWTTFIENCQLCYKAGENIAIDEQLFPTKTRCRFLQYMPNKPDKFGIKFWLAVDVKTKYLLNGLPYLGKDEQRPANESLGEYVVHRLTEPYKRTGRNITTDNYFSSLKLAKYLQENGLSFVGTVNRVRKEVPDSFKSRKNELFSSFVMKTVTQRSRHIKVKEKRMLF